MDVGTVLTVAQTLFAALQCSELKEMCSFLGYQSQLKRLEDTVATVNAVLRDAEAKRELSHEAQRYIEELKDAVYDADDLIDEFVTRAARKQRQLAEGRKVSEKVRHLFSRFKDLGVAWNLSRGVKEVRKRLDDIASNHNDFGFKLYCEPIRKRREETCSYVYDKDIIGREVDKEKIVGMLLDSNVKRDVSFLNIVGIGGLGKTTLAQLVYNDESVKKYFDLRLWACVSDEDPKHLDVKAVISKILGSTTGQKHDDSEMEWLQGQLRQRLSGNKYLLVLDDVWNENRNEWLKLEAFFKEAGLAGSWVVVTTRSKDTAKVVSGYDYDLKGLSDEDSWRLFERIAFGQGEDRENTPELAGIGQTIVKKCANVPLAIRVVASLLYGHGKDKWQSFQDISLGEITKDEKGISSILMLSYHNLDSRLKSCFSYCAIFPKDFRIEKKMLVSLWMAQGYIVPLNKGQSMEDAAEKYFSILLQRCFFQDVEQDVYTTEILWCKMHDLMHDISQKVAGKEVCVLNPMTSDLDKKTRHISYPVRKRIEGETPFTHKIGVRTWLMCDFSAPIMELHMGELFANWVYLRTLDLHGSGIKTLPCLIGNLLHLRYLDLSWNRDLEVLPKSITKLHNIQTLNLSYCDKLIELPNDFSKLVNLWLLDISGCYRMTHMPPGMGKLNGLQWLTMFVVGGVDQLEDLKALTNLKGKLEIYIRIPKDVAYVKGNNSYQGGYLIDKQWLNNIFFKWGVEREANEEYEAALLDDLQPHPNLREVSFYYYCGKRLARWMIESNFRTLFSNLVRISFFRCHGLQHLMSLEKLPHLRELSVNYMRKLEYMEDTRRNTSSHDVGACFFPSLEKIKFLDLPELKGWWKDDDQDQVILDETNTSSSLLPSFPRLSDLNITDCPKLTTIPLCPNVKDLILRRFNERLRVIDKKTSRDLTRSPDTHLLNSSLPSLSDSENPKLRVVKTSCVRRLKAVLPMEAFQCVTKMIILYDKELESLEEVGEVFQSCSSSLHCLEVINCPNLKRLSYSEQEEEEDDDGDMPWRCLHQSLRSVKLFDLPKLVKLPKGMKYLTSLESLNIFYCRALESLPRWMPSLTSLTLLSMGGCSERLVQRCQSPTGEDWPLIQHIPHVKIPR